MCKILPLEFILLDKNLSLQVMETKSGMLMQKGSGNLLSENRGISRTVANTRLETRHQDTLSHLCLLFSMSLLHSALGIYVFSTSRISMAKYDHRMSKNGRRSFVTQDEVVLVLAFWFPVDGALLNDVVMSGSHGLGFISTSSSW